MWWSIIEHLPQPPRQQQHQQQLSNCRPQSPHRRWWAKWPVHRSVLHSRRSIEATWIRPSRSSEPPPTSFFTRNSTETGMWSDSMPPLSRPIRIVCCRRAPMRTMKIRQIPSQNRSRLTGRPPASAYCPNGSFTTSRLTCRICIVAFIIVVVVVVVIIFFAKSTVDWIQPEIYYSSFFFFK